MRASRLLSILMTLQARGQVTASALAEECEVSVRTIYRDIDALSAAGVPVYAERGSEGGYRLLDGYRTRLNGLSPAEAEALFLLGLPGPAAGLGLSAAVANAQLKLLAAIPAEQRALAERLSARFHLDAPGWFGAAEEPAHLEAVVAAVREQRAIHIRYRSWRAEKQRRVEPLGIVLKSGAWYLVGQVNGGPRTYRIARILDLTVTGERFEAPAFDLAAYWEASIRRLEEELHPARAIIRLSPWAMKMLDAFLSPYVRGEMEVAEEADEAGWRPASIPVGSVWHAASQLLRFGPEVEVLGPPELRAKMRDIAASLHGMYADGSEAVDQPANRRG
jgi:predicted DNA-binding transcriptional regulator YafY